MANAMPLVSPLYERPDMKITVQRKPFADALKMVTSIIPTRTPRPILACVQIVAIADAIVISGTDGDMAINTSIAADVNLEGEVVIPAAVLAQIVASAEGDTIDMEVKGTEARIRTPDSEFLIYGFDAQDYPAPIAIDTEKSFTIIAAQLAEMVGQTLFATADAASRYAMNGLLIVAGKKKIEVCATDGRVLALATQPTASGREVPSFILPKRAAAILSRSFAADDELVISASGGRFVATNGGGKTTISGTCIDGAFPPYKDVIPKTCTTTIVASREALKHAVQRAALLVNEESKGVRLDIGQTGIKITSRAPEKGEAEITLDTQSINGPELTIGFNPFFLLDVLKASVAESVTIEFSAGNKPAVVKLPGFVAVIMPINLQ